MTVFPINYERLLNDYKTRTKTLITTIPIPARETTAIRKINGRCYYADKIIYLCLNYCLSHKL